MQQYTYLEIGSHLGGSIQQYLVDPQCAVVYSIDMRPTEVPDERDLIVYYNGNSTARMLENLVEVDADAAGKVVCFDSDARDIDPARIAPRPELCFIDGAHTHESVISDFEFCLRVCAPDAVIYFHDDFIIAASLGEIVRRLQARGQRFTAMKLEGSTFAIALGDAPAASDPVVLSMATDGRRAILLLHIRWTIRQRVKHMVPAPIRPWVRRVREMLGG